MVFSPKKLPYKSAEDLPNETQTKTVGEISSSWTKEALPTGSYGLILACNVLGAVRRKYGATNRD
jgi:hypothetical protein